MTPYLLANLNPAAIAAGYSHGFWGHPSRTKPIRVIVVHTAENTPDLIGVDGGAEAVARYQSTVTRPSSYHRIADSDSSVTMLPDSAVAFGARGANADGLHLAFATKADDWPSMPPDRVDAMLRRGAAIVREWCDRHGIPDRRITRAEWLAGRSGIISHADVDPDRRTDPGLLFLWPRFFDYVRGQEADAMTPEQEAKLDAVVRAVTDDTGPTVAGRVWRVMQALGRMERTYGPGLVDLEPASVDVEALAVEIRGVLGADVAAELARRLSHDPR